jgi:hypothetical protein
MQEGFLHTRGFTLQIRQTIIGQSQYIPVYETAANIGVYQADDRRVAKLSF